MRGVRRRAFAVVLAVGAVLSGGHAVASDGPSPAVSPAPAAKRLDLGPYVEAYGAKPTERILDLPHFETRVDVPGKAMDAAALTARMEWWMRDYEPIRGSVPRQGSAPSLQEIQEYRPHVTEGANLLPVLHWLLGKITKKP
jgi:hypothetical protein